MNLILYLVLVLFAFSEVNGKLKICIPKLLNNENTNSAQEKNPFRETFREILDLFPNQLQEDLIPFELDNDVIRATGYLKNPRVVGDNLTISVCNGLLLPIPKSIILKELEIQGDEYYLNGTVADIFYIFGKGNLDITIDDLTVGIINFEIDWKDLGCFLIDIDLKLGGWKVYLENILDGDDLLEPAINDIIGDMGPDIVDYLWPLIYDRITPLIQEIIDKYINKRDTLRNLDNVFFKVDPSEKSLSEKCKTYVIPF